MSSRAPRVLIADSDVGTRNGVRLALEEREFPVCAEVATASAAVEAAVRERPDICLLDVHLPGGGIAAAAEIVERLPGTAVVMLAASSDDDDMFDALAAGARGYLPKDIDPSRLPVALSAVLAGEAALPRAHVARLVEEFRSGRQRAPFAFVRRTAEDLTSREWEVLEAMRAGLSTADIAQRLYLSQVTVRRHISSIMRKLRVSSRAEAVRLIRRRSPDLNDE